MPKKLLYSYWMCKVKALLNSHGSGGLFGNIEDRQADWESGMTPEECADSLEFEAELRDDIPRLMVDHSRPIDTERPIDDDKCRECMLVIGKAIREAEEEEAKKS